MITYLGQIYGTGSDEYAGGEVIHDETTIQCTPAEFVGIAYGVSEWSISTYINISDVTGTMIPVLGDDQTEIESEYKLGITQNGLITLSCKELIGADPDFDGEIPKLQFYFQTRDRTQPIYFTPLPFPGITEKIYQDGKLTKIGQQPFAYLNGSQLDNSTGPEVGIVGETDFILKAYDREFKFKANIAHIYDMEQDPDGLSLKEITMEATSYWPYGGRYNPTTGLIA